MTLQVVATSAGKYADLLIIVNVDDGHNVPVIACMRQNHASLGLSLLAASQRCVCREPTVNFMSGRDSIVLLLASPWT